MWGIGIELIANQCSAMGVTYSGHLNQGLHTREETEDLCHLKATQLED